MNIDKKLITEIQEYCKLNNIQDVEKEVNRLLRQGFNVEKYGTSPFTMQKYEVPTDEEKTPQTEEKKPKTRVSKAKRVKEEGISSGETVVKDEETKIVKHKVKIIKK